MLQEAHDTVSDFYSRRINRVALIQEDIARMDEINMKQTAKNEGRKEGFDEAMQKFVVYMLKKNIPIEEIEDETKLSREKILEINEQFKIKNLVQ